LSNQIRPLQTTYLKIEIEKIIYKLLAETDEGNFMKIGKNYYATNPEKQIRVTINSNNYRIITVDKI
jgi:hypothetical protein